MRNKSNVDVEFQMRAKAQLELRNREFLSRYRNSPHLFAQEIYEWNYPEELALYQYDIMYELNQTRRVCVRSLHGVGKSATCAMIVHWFALTRDLMSDWKVVTTASAWRQVQKFLWPEIHVWSRKLKWDLIPREPYDERTELLGLSLKLNRGEAFAVVSDKPELIEGAHAPSILYIIDEAKAVNDGTFDAIEGAFSSETLEGIEAYCLVISTPGEPIGRFYDIQTKKPGLLDWKTYHITLEQGIKAGRISPVWAENRRVQWGEHSALYKNRVLGEFAADDVDVVIPIDFIEQANERWRALSNFSDMPVTSIGVDVGRTTNPSVVSTACGYVLLSIESFPKADTMYLSGILSRMANKHKQSTIVIDMLGVGTGVYDRMKEQHDNRVIPFIASAATKHTDALTSSWKFANLRSFAWWRLRELLDPANDYQVAIPPNDLLIGELAAPHYTIRSNGILDVESKDSIVKRIGRSTDHADSVILALVEYNYFKSKRKKASTWGSNYVKVPI